MEGHVNPVSWLRLERSSVAPIPPSFFQDRFLAVNHIQGFKTWTLYPGMLFLSSERWWGSGRRRTTPHEGIDLCFYSDQTGERLAVKAGMNVPSPYAGSVVKIIPDFIAHSVFMRHGHIAKTGAHLFTMFGHVEPGPETLPRSEIKEGRVFSTIADAGAKHRSVQSHLHISQAWVDDTMPVDAITWENISDARIALTDPLAVMGLVHVVEEMRS